MKQFEAVNWNTPDNDYVSMFWEQNIKQFWIDTEYTPSKDIDSFKSLSPEMKLAYMRALGGLTLLDTEQSIVGMPKIIDHIKSKQNQSVLSYMCMMEAIHAKSYSTIFTTVATKQEIDEVFEWVKTQPHLQYKAALIDKFYRNLDVQDGWNHHLVTLYQALVASVCLESFLFYSGFFLPLYLAGQGQMVASSDIIKKIVADESIHGVFVGLLAQEVLAQIKNELRPEVYEELLKFPTKLIEDLMANELKYTEEVYNEVGLTQEVKEYLMYNANKALMNLGLEPIYEHADINQLVLNGLNTDTTQHDFFSKKSTNYEKATEIVHLKNEDFE